MSKQGHHHYDAGREACLGAERGRLPASPLRPSHCGGGARGTGRALPRSRSRPLLTPLSRTCLFLEDRELGRTPVAPAVHGATGGATAAQALPGAQAPRCAPAMPSSIVRPPPRSFFNCRRRKARPRAGALSNGEAETPPSRPSHTEPVQRGTAPHPAAAHGPTGVVVLRAALLASSRQALRGQTTLPRAPRRTRRRACREPPVAARDRKTSCSAARCLVVPVVWCRGPALRSRGTEQSGPGKTPFPGGQRAGRAGRGARRRRG